MGHGATSPPAKKPLGRSAQNFVTYYNLIPTDTFQTVAGVGKVREQVQGREGEKHSEVVLIRRHFGIQKLKR